MKKILFIFCWSLLLVVGIGCEEDPLDIERYGNISGVVVDGENYKPLSGVQIASNPASSAVLTDNEGRFSLSKVTEGEIAITARKKDYLSSTISVAVHEAETTNIRLFLLKDERDVGWVTIYDPVPGNGATDQKTTLTLQWHVDQQEKSKELEYTVYYFESNSIVQHIAGENLTVKEVVVTGLDEGKTYYWYVVAKFEGSRVANSPTWSFKTEISGN